MSVRMVPASTSTALTHAAVRTVMSCRSPSRRVKVCYVVCVCVCVCVFVPYLLLLLLHATRQTADDPLTILPCCPYFVFPTSVVVVVVVAPSLFIPPVAAAPTHSQTRMSVIRYRVGPSAGTTASIGMGGIIASVGMGSWNRKTRELVTVRPR